MNALLAKSDEPWSTLDPDDTACLVKALQDQDLPDTKGLIAVEFAYLSLLEHSAVTTPKTLESALASEPEVFCEIIRSSFRSKKESDHQEVDPTDEECALAQNCYRLLRIWSVIPGTDASGNLSPERLWKWIEDAKKSLEQSGHLAVGLRQAGEVLSTPRRIRQGCSSGTMWPRS